MKWYLTIIIASTLISCSHFFFRGGSPFAEWTVYVGSQMLGGVSILFALTMYLSTKFEKIGVKLLTLIYLVLCCFEFLSWALDGFHHQWWASSLVMILVIAYSFFNASKWDMKDIHGDILSPDKIYFIFRKPDSLVTWFGSLFGHGIGSMYVVYNGHKWYMSKHFNIFKKASFLGLMDNEIAFEISVDGMFGDTLRVTNEMIIEDIEDLKGLRFNYINKNCLTILTSVIEKYHIVEPTSILPSQYVKKFFNRKPLLSLKYKYDYKS